jgi:site-specific recombinase XerD
MNQVDKFKKLSSAASLCNKNLSLIAKKLNNGEGLNHSMNFHCSRHSFAVLSLSRGTRIEYVSKLMGHKDIKVTQIYAKLINEDLDKALDNAFGS